MPKIGDYLKILTDKEVKDFVLINFGKYFKYTREKFYSKISKKILVKLLNCFVVS